MPEIIVYLLKVNLAILLFYLTYRVWLRRLTFHTLNRYFLLFGIVFSFAFPLVNIREWFVEQQPILVEMSAYALDWGAAPVAGFDYWVVVEGLFLGIALYFALQLLVRLASLWRIHRQSLPAGWRSYNYRQVLQRVSPFSFWRTIYLHIESHEAHELSEIFEHEQVHVDGLHTVDILLAEMLVLLCWFNPGAWLLRGAIRENLEFLADRCVLQSGVDSMTYQYSLLRLSTDATNPALTNGFNFKHLKRRIAMMNTARSSRAHLSKYVFALPAIVAFVFVFTFTKAYQREADTAHPEASRGNVAGLRKIDTATVAGKDEVVFAGVDTIPPAFREIFDGAKKRGARKGALDSSLIVVDGVITSKAGLDAIDVHAIQSISMIKDAAATALYGSRGANGVILITTKKAEEGRKGAVSGAVWPSKDYDDLLFVVDGTAVSADEFRKLSADDIDAIHVWKGENAVEKYGEKGAKGTVQVTTKGSGKKAE